MGIRLSSGNRGSIGMKIGDAALAAKYAQEAKAAAEAAQAAVIHPPRISETGVWQIWDQGSGYVDSGVRAEGLQGAKGDKGDPGTPGMPNVWFGSLAEYNALPAIDPAVAYFIEETPW